MAKVLVVYYSRTGQTRRAVEAVARRLECDVDALTESKNRQGPFGYFSALLAGLMRRRSTLTGMRRDPSMYQIVVLATPVWSGGACAPVREYLERYRRLLPEVAFLITCGSGRAENVVQELKRLSNRDPEAVLVLNDVSFLRGDLDGAVEELAEKIQTHLRVAENIPVTPSDAAPPPEA